MKPICPVTGCLSIMAIVLVALIVANIGRQIQAERERPAVTYVDYVNMR